MQKKIILEVDMKCKMNRHLHVQCIVSHQYKVLKSMKGVRCTPIYSYPMYVTTKNTPHYIHCTRIRNGTCCLGSIHTTCRLHVVKASVECTMGKYSTRSKSNGQYSTRES